jgi:hypothetical protein
LRKLINFLGLDADDYSTYVISWESPFTILKLENSVLQIGLFVTWHATVGKMIIKDGFRTTGGGGGGRGWFGAKKQVL